MKHFVKRDIIHIYESSMLKLEDSWEWAYLRSGVDSLISESDERIKFLTDSLKIVHGSVDKLQVELDEELEKKKFLEKMISALDVRNEITI